MMYITREPWRRKSYAKPLLSVHSLRKSTAIGRSAQCQSQISALGLMVCEGLPHFRMFQLGEKICPISEFTAKTCLSLQKKRPYSDIDSIWMSIVLLFRERHNIYFFLHHSWQKLILKVIQVKCHIFLYDMLNNVQTIATSHWKLELVIFVSNQEENIMPNKNARH